MSSYVRFTVMEEVGRERRGEERRVNMIVGVKAKYLYPAFTNENGRKKKETDSIPFQFKQK